MEIRAAVIRGDRVGGAKWTLGEKVRAPADVAFVEVGFGRGEARWGIN